jgi:hypothetical protein
MVNRPISYFYNNFFRDIRRFCVIGQQPRVRLPEIRAARSRFRPKNRAFPSQSELSRRGFNNARLGTSQRGNIFSLWLSYNDAADLFSKSYAAIVTLAPGQRTEPPHAGSVDNENSSFLVNRLQRSNASLQCRKLHTAEAARRRLQFARRHARCGRGADCRAQHRRRSSFFHIETKDTARIAQPDFGGSFRLAARALRTLFGARLETMDERGEDWICEAL